MLGAIKHLKKPGVGNPNVPPSITLALGDSTSSSVTLNWTYSTGTNGQVGPTYTVWKQTSGGGYTSVGTTTSLTYNVTGLTTSVAYDFYVTTSECQSNTVSITLSVAATVPGAPTNFVATGLQQQNQDGQISFSWTAPNNGGAALIEYEISHSADNVSWSTTTAFVAPATSASYISVSYIGYDIFFRIRARNSVGWGAYSNTSLAHIWGFTTVTYTSGAGTWVKPTGTTALTALLVVGGGGGGGSHQGAGGGGAGEVVVRENVAVTGNVNYLVGMGGSGGTAGRGSTGSASNFGSYSAAGGGGGGGFATADPYEDARNGGSGGSGGGASRYDYGAGYTRSGGSQTAAGVGNYGTAGANSSEDGFIPPSWAYGGGGGGAGSQGGYINNPSYRGNALSITQFSNFVVGYGGGGGTWSPNGANGGPYAGTSESAPGSGGGGASTGAGSAGQQGIIKLSYYY